MLKIILFLIIVSLSACTFGPKEISNKDALKSSVASVEGSLVPAKLWSNPSKSPITTGPINSGSGILK